MHHESLKGAVIARSSIKEDTHLTVDDDEAESSQRVDLKSHYELGSLALEHCNLFSGVQSLVRSQAKGTLDFMA